MAKLLKLRRGTTSQHSSFTGAEGEVTVDTDKEVLVVHDGSTAGGHAMAAQDMDNVPAGAILGTQLENSGVTAGQYGSSSAIPIVTVDAQGLVTAASTTAIDSTTIANGTSNVAVANNGNITTTRSGTARLVVDDAGVDVTGTLDVTGNVGTTGNVTIANTAPSLFLEDTDSNADFQIQNAHGTLLFYDPTNSATRASIDSNGTLDVNGNLDANQGIDVTGDITVTGKLDIGGSTGAAIEVPTDRSITLGNSGEFYLLHSSNYSQIKETGSDNLYIDSNYVYLRDANGSTKLQTSSGGVGVTGNITVTGTVDGVDVATRDTLFGGLTSSSGVLTTGVTAHTYAATDDSNKVATTAFVKDAITAYNFPSGTKMLFQQTSAPTGWTKITSAVNNKSLRVVSGTVGSGGNVAFTTAFAARGINANAANTTQGGNISVANTTAGGNVSISSVSTSGNVNSHTLSSNEMPSHKHNVARNNHSNYWGSETNQGGFQQLPQYTYKNAGSNYSSAGGTGFYTEHTGGGGGHTHGFTGSSHTHNGTLSGTAHTHNATFSGSAHNHSISVDNLDMQVEYLDVIIASKD